MVPPGHHLVVCTSLFVVPPDAWWHQSGATWCHDVFKPLNLLRDEWHQAWRHRSVSGFFGLFPSSLPAWMQPSSTPRLVSRFKSHFIPRFISRLKSRFSCRCQRLASAVAFTTDQGTLWRMPDGRCCCCWGRVPGTVPHRQARAAAPRPSAAGR